MNYNCTEKDARDFVEAQKRVYEIYSQAEIPPADFVTFSFSLQKKIERDLNLDMAFDRLKEIGARLEKTRVEEKYEAIEKKLKE